MTRLQPSSAIAHVEPDRITVRGYDLCADLIGQISFTDYAFLLIAGEKPSDDQSAILNACLVALAEHGLVPSVQAARMTFAAAPEALHGAVSAGLLGCGSVILGSSEVAGRMLADIVARVEQTGDDLRTIVREHVSELRATKSPLPGFGHPVHRQEDPRSTRLLAYARERRTFGRHCEALIAVVEAVPDVYGRHLPLNVSGAIPAVLLDVGFPMRALKGIPLIGRTASLLAHLLEEMDRPIGFALSSIGEEHVAYDGPASKTEDKE